MQANFCTVILVEFGCTLFVWFLTLVVFAATYEVVLCLSRIRALRENGDAQLVVVGTVGTIAWGFQAALVMVLIKWALVGDFRRSMGTDQQLPEGERVGWSDFGSKSKP